MPSFDLAQLQLAFACHVVHEIVGADGDVHEGEQQWLTRTFPSHTLSSSGFLDDDGEFTETYRAALDQALAELPERLSKPQKLALLETFLDATLADDELHHTEGGILVQAAEQLGISSSELDAHLDSLEQVGAVDLDDALED